MNRISNSFIAFIVILLALFAPACGWAQNPPTCPVSYSRLQMPLRHRDGASTPVVQLSFTNETKKKIERAKFGLILINSDGSLAPYDKMLTFTAGADPGKVASAEWALDMEKVDIYHQGQTVYLVSVEFADNTTWKDDGNERCRDDVYFGPK